MLRIVFERYKSKLYAEIKLNNDLRNQGIKFEKECDNTPDESIFDMAKNGSLYCKRSIPVMK